MVYTDSLTFFHGPIFSECTVRLLDQIRYAFYNMKIKSNYYFEDEVEKN